MHDLHQTIVAIATAPGRGGVGCVRVSGPRAFEVARGLVRGGDSLDLPGSGRPRFVTVSDPAGAAIDHGYVVAFPKERSYTGEPSVELWVHGSPPVLRALVTGAIASGSVAAEPGEFTYRALRHGRLDLARAEAVRDLVEARTLHQARIAFGQIEGALARRLAPLKDLLVELLARGEAAVEFVDEAEVHLGSGRLEAGLGDALAVAEGLLREVLRGQVHRDGARVAIVGVTSVGKSSLFNRLLGNDRAIVSDVPGTTRDTLEETIDLDGIPITLIDTAGLRETRNSIEAEGVRRARVAAREAELTILVLDATRPLLAAEKVALARHPEFPERPPVVAVNKIDTLAPGDTLPWPGGLPVSAATGTGIEALRAGIAAALVGAAPGEAPAMTNARHAAAMEGVVEALREGARAMASGLSDEAALEDLRRALDHLGAITGEVATDDLYDKIFSTFCIGK